MSEISKIIIKGTSGWCRIEEAYKDKVTVTSDGISYEYKPRIKTEINPSRKWSYKTTSPIYKKLFSDLVQIMPSFLHRDKDLDCTDVGSIEFILTYSDETKFKATFFQSGDEFKDCFRIIKQMVPECEYAPAVLLTEDNYED